MKNKKIFYILLVVAYILAMLGLFLDLGNINRESWTLTYYTIAIELLAVIMVAIAVNMRWPSNLTKILSLSFFGSCCMLLMIEIENMQWVFTKEFIIGSIILCIALPVIFLTLGFLWPGVDLFDVEVIEVESL